MEINPKYSQLKELKMDASAKVEMGEKVVDCLLFS